MIIMSYIYLLSWTVMTYKYFFHDELFRSDLLCRSIQIVRRYLTNA